MDTYYVLWIRYDCKNGQITSWHHFITCYIYETYTQITEYFDTGSGHVNVGCGLTSKEA